MQPAQYRPLTIPSNILRLLTVRLCSDMSSIAEEHQMLGPEQFGFRKKRSTIDAVFVLFTMFQKAKLKSWPFAASFIDISKVISTFSMLIII